MKRALLVTSNSYIDLVNTHLPTAALVQAAQRVVYTLPFVVEHDINRPIGLIVAQDVYNGWLLEVAEERRFKHVPVDYITDMWQRIYEDPFQYKLSHGFLGADYNEIKEGVYDINQIYRLETSLVRADEAANPFTIIIPLLEV